MNIPAKSWIVVADGQKALFLQNAGNAVRPDLRLIEKEVLQNPPTREQGSDRPGRFPDTVHGRSSVEQTDWHEFEKSRFAHDVAMRLNQAALAGAFENLILVAPAATLGELRPILNDAVAGCLRAEIPKDLTAHPLSAILSHIESFE